MKYCLRTLSLLTLIVVIMMSSCKKDDETKTDVEYLSVGNWKTTACTVNPGIEMEDGTIITDIYNSTRAGIGIPECSKDNLNSFIIDGEYIVDEGAMKCEPDDPQTISGTWILSVDGKTITITYDGIVVVLTLISINDSTLVVSFPFYEDTDSPTATMTLTLQ
mgnify:FL=1